MQATVTRTAQLGRTWDSLLVAQLPGNRSVSQLLHNPALNLNIWRYRKLQKKQLGSDPF
jgi:hypothetical protein